MNDSTTLLVRAETDSPRVAIVAPSLDILGGQGVQACGLARELRREGFEVLFVPVNPRFPRGVRWLRRIPGLRTLLNQLLYIPGLLRLRRADVVHVFSASYWSFLISPMPALVAGRLLGKRVVLNYHSGEALDHLTNWGLLVHPWLRLAHEIVVPSPYLREVFGRFGYPARVIRNSVDTASFRYRERDPLRPRLLSCRNLEAHYGVAETLRAYALIKAQVPEASLTVAGYGSEEQALKAQVRNAGLADVRFVGRVEPEDMPRLYDEADIFLNSSTVDNQPISILEAFAAGLNVVSTPVGDIPAMVRDGVTGCLVESGKPQSMADAVLALLDDQRRAAAIRRRAFEEVEKYTWPQVGREWAGLYRRGRS